MRSWLVVVALSTGAGAEPVRWQQATNAPSIQQVWGVDGELYGVGPAGVHRSTDGGSTWASADRSAANGIWGTAVDDLWVVRDRTLHHSIDGAGAFWTNQRVPVPFATTLEGIWGVGSDRYAFGVDRSSQTGVLVHSRDRGQTWRAESIALPRVTSVWGRTAGDVFAVGGRDVMRSTGDGSWAVMRTGTEVLHAIGGTAKTLYAVGDNGTILAFDGKTWTRRTTGVTYALSSVTVGSEIYVGSNEGSPLRSIDGVTWKPLTALVPKGHVWASRTTVIAVAGEVHVLGGLSPPIVVPSNPLGLPVKPSLSLGKLTEREALGLRLRLDDDQLPHRRDLLSIVTSRLGDGFPVLPRLARAGAPPTLRLDELKDCGGYVPPAWSPTALIPARITCSSTCGMVKVTARILAGPASEVAAASGALAIASCSDQPLGTQVVVERIARDRVNAYLAKLLVEVRKTTPGTDLRVDALAHYLLEGGDDPHARRALAAELGVPDAWSGLFWNPAPARSWTRSLCTLEQSVAADAAESDGHQRFGEALTSYEAIIPCNKSYVEQAAISACKAHARLKARLHYSELSADKQPAIVQVCLENGIDPRVP